MRAAFACALFALQFGNERLQPFVQLLDAHSLRSIIDVALAARVEQPAVALEPRVKRSAANGGGRLHLHIIGPRLAHEIADRAKYPWPMSIEAGEKARFHANPGCLNALNRAAPLVLSFMLEVVAQLDAVQTDRHRAFDPDCNSTQPASRIMPSSSSSS